MNIFELTTEIATANTDLFATEEEIEQKLEVLFYELGKREDGLWTWFKATQADINLADEYISKIQRLKKVRQNSQKWMKNTMIEVSEKTGKLPKHSVFNPLKVMESKSVDIIDESKIPETYWIEVITKKLDKKRMLADMKQGKKIPGADIATNKYMRGLK